MDKRKKTTFQVIIAHPIPEEQQHIAELLESDGGFSVCHMTHDGLDCLHEAVSLQPDLLIVNAVLDKIDGLEVLRRLKGFPLPDMRRVYITDHQNYLCAHACLAGADHCILTPYPDEILVQRVRELLIPPRHAIPDERIDAHTAAILLAIGAPDHLKGYYYTIEAVRILVRDPRLVMRRRVTKELYGAIAKRHGLKNAGLVERAMRTLTEHIFKKNNLESLERYFNPADIQRSGATNTAFLTAIANHVVAALQEETPELRLGAN